MEQQESKHYQAMTQRTYTQGTALVLRAKDCVMKVVTMVQENAEDIYEAAKNVNEERAAKKEAAEFEDAEETEETETEEAVEEFKEVESETEE